MRSRFRLVTLALVLSVVGCGDDDGPAGSPDGGMDSAVPDAGPPDSGPPDAGPPDAGAWIGEGCDPATGIECDGHWEGRCTPECDDDACCAPVGGSFRCMPREADDACPAADIWVDEGRALASISVEWRFFPDGDCAMVEGCVSGTGWRRLLLFDTWTPNTGTADMYIGPPEDMPSYFVYSECHDHHHFETYAAYQLRDGAGAVVADGHKQAFCLLDFYRYPGEDDRGAHYDCDDQGIQRGWQDVYGTDLDCQWVDVTDVVPGDYDLEIALNTEHVLLESDYGNNVASIAVTIPEDVDPDVTLDCPGARMDPQRSCGLVREGLHTCTAGEMITVGCSAACGLGSCEGDTVLRACEVAHDPTCTVRRALAWNDDSGCSGDDVCSQIMFTCPADGQYVVFTGGYDTTVPSTCTVATLP
jgi:hypothetical protein